VDLGGEASFDARRRTAAFDLAGPLLDLDTLLAALPAGAEPRVEDSPEDGPLPESMREQLSSVTARGRLRVDRMVVKELVSERVTAEASLSRGVLTVTRADADLYGGKLAASGTRLDLTQPQPRWVLSADLSGMDLGNALQRLSGANPVVGRSTAG
jgi:uncharacterized protein involved in outer membrane biogenesis